MIFRRAPRAAGRGITEQIADTFRGWLGLGERWYRGQVNVEPQPVIVVGHENSDGAQLEAFSYQSPVAGAGDHHAFGIEAATPIWVTQVYIQASISSLGQQMGIMVGQLTGATTLVGDPDCRWLRQSAGGTGPGFVLPWRAVQGAAFPAVASIWRGVVDEGWFYFADPGLLVPEGHSVLIQGTQGNDRPRATIVFRRADA